MKNTNKIQIIIIFILPLLISSCSTFGPRPDNTKPMYGEVPMDYRYVAINLRFIEDAIEFHGNRENAVDYFLRAAWEFFYRGNLNVAMMRFNQVWLLNPEIPDIYFGFAALLEVKGNKTEAERFYKIGFEKDVNNDRAEGCLVRIIYCKENIGDINGTIETCKKYIEINPNNAVVYTKMGYWQNEIGKDTLALESYTKAIEIDSNYANAYVNRGYVFQTQNKYSEAKADYLKAIDVDPEYISAYANKGGLELILNNYEEAKKDFEKGVELDPESGELRRYLGIAKLKLNDELGACEDFKLAKELGDLEAEKLLKQNCK